MITVQGHWIGLEGIGLAELKALEPKAVRAVTRATLYYEGKVKKKLSGPRTGRIYIIRGRPHQASAPGEPPATLTGELRQSIGHELVFERDTFWGEVGSPLVKARTLEFGGITGNGARILPRPYFSATFLDEEQAILAILETAVDTKESDA